MSVPGKTSLTAVAAGTDFSLGVTATGGVLAWGDNSGYELGNGTSTNSDVPVAAAIAGGTTVTSVAAGGAFALALTSTGQVLAWGQNNLGGLGDGTYANSALPVSVTLPSGTTVTAVAAGNEFALALTSTGQVLAWGDNFAGQLGNGGTSVEPYSDLPVSVTLPSGTTVTAVAAGYDFALALTSTGQVLAWGDNNFGQLGNGTTTSVVTPVSAVVPAGDTVTQVVSGSQIDSSYALTSTGQVLAWGDGSGGALGNGSTADSSTPVVVSIPGSMAATAVTAGYLFAAALTSTGSTLTWGSNPDGRWAMAQPMSRATRRCRFPCPPALRLMPSPPNRNSSSGSAIRPPRPLRRAGWPSPLSLRPLRPLGHPSRLGCQSRTPRGPS